MPLDGTPRGRPTTGEQLNFRPGRSTTAAVAVALVTAAGLYTGASLERRPRWLFRTGAAGAATVLAARAIGDGRHLGVTKTNRDSAFARLDTMVLTPVCAALAIAGFAVV